MTIEIPDLTPEQLMAEIEDMMSESWVDPMEVDIDEFDYNSYPDAPHCVTNGILTLAYAEDPTLNSEVGFDQEFLRECD